MKTAKKLRDFDQAVEDELSNDCGCGKTMRDSVIQTLRKELEEAARQRGL